MQPESQVTESASNSDNRPGRDRLTRLRQEMVFLNTMGKRFVAALDRFQVHRALLATLQELYSFSACSILMRGTSTYELSIIPRYPFSPPFLQEMFEKIARAASVIGFPNVDSEDLAIAAYLDAPDDLTPLDAAPRSPSTTIGDFLNIPLTVDNRIIGILSLFDEREQAFDTNLLQLTTMIADYAAVALENVRLRERETALWRAAEMERLRLERIISSMAEGMLITDQHGIVTSLNRSAQQLFSQVQVYLDEGTLVLALTTQTGQQRGNWLVGRTGRYDRLCPDWPYGTESGIEYRGQRRYNPTHPQHQCRALKRSGTNPHASSRRGRGTQ